MKFIRVNKDYTRDQMKRCLFFIILLLIVSVSVASAADSSDHEQYRVISFSFNNEAITEEDGNTANLFDPLLITGSRSDILSRNPFFVNEFGTSDPQTTTSGFAVAADFMATPKISLHGTIGVTKNIWDASENSSYNSSWEANLGVEYKFFKNLSYGVHFGYMDPGDLYRKSSNSYDSVESIIMVSNKLTMSF